MLLTNARLSSDLTAPKIENSGPKQAPTHRGGMPLMNSGEPFGPYLSDLGRGPSAGIQLARRCCLLVCAPPFSLSGAHVLPVLSAPRAAALRS